MGVQSSILVLCLRAEGKAGILRCTLGLEEAMLGCGPGGRQAPPGCASSSLACAKHTASLQHDGPWGPARSCQGTLLVAGHPPRAIFSCVPSKAPVPLALHQLWLSWRWQFLCIPWVVLFLPSPLHSASPGPPDAGHIPGGAEPTGLERAGRVPEMGQSPTEGSQPRAGGRAGCTLLWASACRVAASVAGTEPALALL